MNKAIYYVGEVMTSSVLFEYSTKEEFDKLIGELNTYVEVLSIFGNAENKNYSLFKQIDYNRLLLDRVAGLYLINRVGEVILFKNTVYLANNMARYGVLKLDAVLSEQNSEIVSLYEGQSYRFLLTMGIVMGVALYFNWNSKSNLFL